MEERGYVVCLLKYILEDNVSNISLWNKRSGNEKSVCLGYFGRINVTPVCRFKEYLDKASKYDAGFMGSRKQLMLYPFDGKMPEQLTRRDIPDGEINRIPFRPVDGADDLCFCCLTIVSIDHSIKTGISQKTDTDSLKYIGKIFSEQMDFYIKQNNIRMPNAVMGLLGTEDLCIILLSDDYSAISGVVGHLGRLVDKNSGKHFIINSHSLLMMDIHERTELPRWGEANAKLHFSLKTVEGIKYLEKVRSTIEEHIKEGQSVVLESQIGEYDAAIQCPASALGAYLYGDEGLLSYRNPDYQKAVFQSETILFSVADLEALTPVEVETPLENIESDNQNQEIRDQGITTLVEQAIKEINDLLDDGDTTYIQQALYRLLKDYQRIASIPLGGMLQEDLHIQFEVAVNAIVCAARRFWEILKVNQKRQVSFNSQFENQFSRIVDTLNTSMQAACQVDRLCFEEQQSHLQNTGAHYKVLMAYYGIVKDLLQLMYAIPRSKNSHQPLLVPLLAFGHTPIIYSEQFESSYGNKPAKLISITLPYHALANVPKYIGPLTHEMFHYSVPADRSVKNAAAGKCLVAIAIRCLLENTGKVMKQQGIGWNVFYWHQNAYWQTVESVYDNICKNINELLTNTSQNKKYLSADELPSDVYFGFFRASLFLPQDFSEAEKRLELYRTAWLELREHIRGEVKRKDIIVAFGFQEEHEKKVSPETFIQNALKKCFAQLSIDLHGYLAVYEMVLREVPPDLFDIGCVMQGKSNELKAKQYLWQIHSIRNDKFFYKTNAADRTLDGNTVRIGVILDQLLYGDNRIPDREFVKRDKNMSKKLEEWYPDTMTGTQKKHAERNKTAIESDYNKYSAESIFTDVLLKGYIGPVLEQLKQLSEQNEAAAIMKKLTGFYSRYYNILDNEQEEDKQADAIFSLAIDLIECYQCQPELREIVPSDQDNHDWTHIFDTYLQHNFTPGLYNWNYTIKVFGPVELSEKMISAYTTMELTDTEPLWFRGEHVAGRLLLPGIMRSSNGRAFDPDGFLSGMRRMMIQAKAKILPEGRQFHKAEWLALLQHYSFKTNLLDWSEELYSALYFATERWAEGKNQDKDAEINLLNPTLFNLAVDFLEDGPGAQGYLKRYLSDKKHKNTGRSIALFTNGEDNKSYRCFYDLNIPNLKPGQRLRLPIAAMTPITNERMKMQSGVFIFFDLRTCPGRNMNYNDCSVASVQRQYVIKAKSVGIQPIPFLYTIVLDHHSASEFVQYVRAIGMRKYRVYPELDNLAEDIMKQSL